VDDSRTWGDGVGDVRPHVVQDINLEPDTEHWSLCGPCDAIVYIGDFLTMERAWQDHRGMVYITPRAVALATDAEVEEFLRNLEQPRKRPTARFSHMAGSKLATTPDDMTDAFELMQRLLDEHWPRDPDGCRVCASLS